MSWKRIGKVLSLCSLGPLLPTGPGESHLGHKGPVNLAERETIALRRRRREKKERRKKRKKRERRRTGRKRGRRC